MAAMSPNLQAIFGLTIPSEGANIITGDGEERRKNSDWRPPAFHGLGNSKTVTTLATLVIGQEKGLQMEYRDRQEEEEGECGQDGEGDEEWSEEEGWDYEGV